MISVRSPARSPWVLPEKAGVAGGNAGALPEHEAQLLGRLLQGVNGGSSSGFCPCRTVGNITWLAPCMQDFLMHHWSIPNHKTRTSALQVAPSFGLELLISESFRIAKTTSLPNWASEARCSFGTIAPLLMWRWKAMRPKILTDEPSSLATIPSRKFWDGFLNPLTGLSRPIMYIINAWIPHMGWMSMVAMNAYECHLPYGTRTLHACDSSCTRWKPLGLLWNIANNSTTNWCRIYHPKPACRSCPPGSQILETFEPEEEVTRRANIVGLADRAKDRNGAGWGSWMGIWEHIFSKSGIEDE